MAQETKDTVDVFRPGYKQKNQAPDKIPTARVATLALAYNIAKEKKLLPPGLDMDILAMSILEGREDYGNNANAYADNKKMRTAVEHLFGGKILPYQDQTYSSVPVRSSAMLGSARLYTEDDMERRKRGLDTEGHQLDDALLMMLKLYTNVDRGPQKMIQRYNGVGPASEKYVDLVGKIKA